MFLSVFFLLGITTAKAQKIYVKSVDQTINKYTLEAGSLETLPKYPGSNTRPSYGFFWIFEDDGTFSFNEFPNHQFGVNKHVSMEATPRYTPINRYPQLICHTPIYSQGITTSNNPTNPNFPFSSYNKSVKIQSSRDPFHEHERTIVISYENPTQSDINAARITLYFNSNETSLEQSNDAFNQLNQITNLSGNTINGIKAYNEETLPGNYAVYPSQEGSYDSEITINIPKIVKHTKHNLFLRFRTDILSGLVDMKVRFIASNDFIQIDQTENLNQAVVSAYDPNRIIVDKEYINYNDIAHHGEKLTYTVHFQNEGDGPTNGLNIVCKNNSDLEMGSVYHDTSKFENELKLPLKIIEKGIHWNYNLSLPGSNQVGYECDQEATKGWMRFVVNTYNADFYQSNYGVNHTINNTAFIEFPQISIMETQPASTFLSESDLKNSTISLIENKKIKNKNSLQILKAFKTNNSELMIQISNINCESLKISLLNIQGQTVHFEQIQLKNQSYLDISIPVSSFKNGLYILSVQSESAIATTKLIL